MPQSKLLVSPFDDTYTSPLYNPPSQEFRVQLILGILTHKGTTQGVLGKGVRNFRPWASQTKHGARGDMRHEPPPAKHLRFPEDQGPTVEVGRVSARGSRLEVRGVLNMRPPLEGLHVNSICGNMVVSLNKGSPTWTQIYYNGIMLKMIPWFGKPRKSWPLFQATYRICGSGLPE